MKQIIVLIIFLSFQSFQLNAKVNPTFLTQRNSAWVDSLMNRLSLDQKIGQLFMIQAYSNNVNDQTEELLRQISNYEIGGIIFMQGSPVMQASICNQFQKASNVPLLVAIDAETGLGFRLDSTLNYPVQMALGAITNDTLIYKMGLEVGEQCRRLGIHMNMAPVCDINTNPENPVINYRSFGEDKIQVARKSWLYAQGMQDAGIIAVAKHFPGHGDTQTDSHLGLPVISQSKSQLDSIELFPFSYLINKGIGAVMTGHLQVPVLEPNKKLPATLSSKIIRKKLKNDLGFEGLVITDAMNMKGVANLYSSAESSVLALKAGNDMIEIIPRLDRAITAVKQAVLNGEISEAEIDEKCRKILAVKKWVGLDKQRIVQTKNLTQELNKSTYQLTKRLLQEQSLTVLQNLNDILPLKNLDTLKIASLVIGSEQVGSFQQMLDNYAEVDDFNISKTPSEQEIDELINQLKPYNLLILGIQGMSLYPYKRFGITDQQITLIHKLRDKKSVTVFFGNPYALSDFPETSNSDGLIMAYQDDEDVQEMAAQLIFGATGATGKLPVTVKNMFPRYSGIKTLATNRLKYTVPEEVGISSTFLKQKFDSLANDGIRNHAFPGCRVLVAKDGKVIFNTSYGYLTYDSIEAVQSNILYDLASVTKITAALPVIMKLYEEKKIDLDTPFSNYFIEFKNTNKSGISFRDILTHQARLQSSIPFWLEKGSTTKLRKGVFQDQPSDKYQVRVSSDLYVRNDFKNVIISDIIKSPLRTRKEYHYSDLGFSLIPFVAERITGTSFATYLDSEFLKPLGAVSMGYKPYERFPILQIAPTENDETFRNELLQGYVHDELTALLGGVSGNAGLFSTTNDLAKVMQMYLQNGYYGGKQYLAPATIKEFTKVQFPQSKNRRALGFDKPDPNIFNQNNRTPSKDASPSSYGHSGFTGVFTWVDPANQTLFVFLSNRVYPTRRNTAIYDLNIRTQMHQAIYDAIRKGL